MFMNIQLALLIRSSTVEIYLLISVTDSYKIFPSQKLQIVIVQ